MDLRAIFFTFLSILPLVLLEKSYIPVFINKLNTGHEVYSADIKVGSPPIPYRLQIDFGYDKISIFKDLEEISTTYSPQLGGYDNVVFSSGSHYIPVVSDPSGERTRMKNEFRCVDCQGVLGLSYNSVFFKLFGKIGFSNRYITLGDDPEEVRISKEPSHLVECQRGRKALCITTSGSLTFNNVHFNNVTINIDPSSQELALPPGIYDEYMEGKNIYKGIDHSPITLRSFSKERWEEGPKDLSSLSYEIDANDFIFSSRTKKRILGIKREESGNTITIGSRVLRNFIIERSTEGLALTSFTTYDSVDDVNLIFFLIQIILILRWTVVNIDIFNMSVEDWNLKYPWFEIFYEWFGVAITTIAIALPQTSELLENHRDLYIGTWFLFAFAVGAKIFIKVYYTLQDNQNYFLKKFRTHYLRLLNSFLEQVVLLTGLWILVLQSRTEGGDSAVLFIVNVIILFTISFYFKIAVYEVLTVLIFSGYKEDVYNGLILPRINKQLGVFVFFTLTAYIYQILVAINFFARPFFIKDFNLQDRFTIPVLILLYLFTEIISSLFLNLFIHYNSMKFKRGEVQRGK